LANSHFLEAIEIARGFQAIHKFLELLFDFAGVLLKAGYAHDVRLILDFCAQHSTQAFEKDFLEPLRQLLENSAAEHAPSSAVSRLIRELEEQFGAPNCNVFETSEA
jgi:hypothetical protein